MIVHLVKTAVFWLNAFPVQDGVSSLHSPRYLMTGYEIDYKRHVHLEVGEYVQTHENHNNDMQPWAIGAICLGPTGNRQGGHYFLSLVTGDVIARYAWTPLPMPQDAII